MRRIFISAILLFNLLGQNWAVSPANLARGQSCCSCGCSRSGGECCCHKSDEPNHNSSPSWSAGSQCGKKCPGSFARVFRDNMTPVTVRLAKQIPFVFQVFRKSSGVLGIVQGAYPRFLYQRPPPPIFV
jgi:hypothetical protein